MQKKFKAFLALILALSMTFMLAACGEKTAKPNDDEQEPVNSAPVDNADDEKLEDMQEVAFTDGSASFRFEKSWVNQETGMDNYLAMGDEKSNEMIMVFQITKQGVYNIGSIDELVSMIETSYTISEQETRDDIEVPGMSGIKAYNCAWAVDSVKGAACMVYGETDYAYYAIGYMADKWKDSMDESFKLTCKSFKENASSASDVSGIEMTDTVRWFNAAYAVLTEINNWDYSVFGGMPVNSTSQQVVASLLEEWWDVTDRETADETLDWILSEGHRTGFAEDAVYLDGLGMGEATDRKEFMLTYFDVDEDEAERNVLYYEFYEQYGTGAIDGWDYARALNLLSYYYVAGYYTQTEALDASLAIAETVQAEFESWDEFMASYMRGYEYWAEESSEERQGIYEELKGRGDNPYAVDFKTELTKTW